MEIEQARNGHSNKYIAEKLGMSQQEYCLRKESGKFLMSEIMALLQIYNKPFEYLFWLEE
ncbi:MAG: hypothetical protein FWE57_08915 [Chitinispirillia bacterium]|nr:hypothetical protein [Chitinispirillia bacterium]